MQIASIVISMIAIIISAISAWNSVRQIRRTQRTRLGQLIDDISKGNFDYDKELIDRDFSVDERLVSNFWVRQEILARQALAIVPSFRGRISSRELTVLADTLAKINDYDTATDLYLKALKIGAGEGASYLSMIHQAYGDFLFTTGDADGGSCQLRLAVEVFPEPKGDRALQRRFYCVGLRAVRHAEYKYKLDVAQTLLAEASQIIEKVKTQDYRDEMKSDLEDYSEQLGRSRQTTESADPSNCAFPTPWPWPPCSSRRRSPGWPVGIHSRSRELGRGG